MRLTRGEREQQTTYSDDAAGVAAAFADEGATWLHLVNLDGAFREGAEAPNRAAIVQVLTGTALQVQLGGGLRTLDDIDDALQLGCARVILGSVAVEAPALVEEAVLRFGPDAIVVGIDARGGVTAGAVRTRGWTEAAAVTPVALAQAMVARGVRRFVYTDIDRDGMLRGPDVEGAAQLAAAAGADVIASGGVGALDHLGALVAAAPGARPGRLDGVIVGKALYEGAFSVAEALGVLGGT